MEKDIFKNLKKIKLLTETTFEKDLLNAVFQNLNDKTNTLRYNNFAYSLRELSRHFLKRLAPDEQVLKCSWYKNEIQNKDNGITRRQRIVYAIQGGLSDAYLRDELNLSFNDKITEILKSISSLSKFTHINKDTFNINGEVLINMVNDTSNKFLSLFKLITACNNSLIKKIEERIAEKIDEHTVNECIEEIDELSTHHNIEFSNIDRMSICMINSSEIKLKIEGYLHVRQQWGSNRDVRNDEGFVQKNNFSFSSILTLIIPKLPEYVINMTNFQVDTRFEDYDAEINNNNFISE